MSTISSCGLICDQCSFYEKPCAGCYKVLGKTFWAKDLPEKECPLYGCAHAKKKYSSCSACSNLPCDLFEKVKDPSLSDEEHQRGIAKRVENLKR